jgi:RING finger/CHY zinc finger protein 1
MHTSRKALHVPKCGHILHKSCLDRLISNGHTYTCPTCNKALFDMNSYYSRLEQEIQATPMPEEYRSLVVEILCNECQRRSVVPFHILGHKCSSCSAYNTVRVKGPTLRSELPTLITP